MICTGGRFEVFSDAANDANLTGCYTIFICKQLPMLCYILTICLGSNEEMQCLLLQGPESPSRGGDLRLLDPEGEALISFKTLVTVY